LKWKKQMSNSRLQKEHQKFNMGLIEKPSNKLQRKFDRFNYEKGFEKNERNKLKNKILTKDFEV